MSTTMMSRVPGRHRELQRTGLIVAAAGLATVVVAGGAWAGYHELSDKGCTTTVSLRVAAAAEIAPAVKATADAWSTKDGTCVTVALASVDPAVMAAAIGSRHGVNLAGVGVGKVDPEVDAWIPDSSTWLLRIASEAPGFLPANLGSVAES